jgi:hypothetical protein
MKRSEKTFAVCVNNKGYPASLELRKLYQVIPDELPPSLDKSEWSMNPAKTIFIRSNISPQCNCLRTPKEQCCALASYLPDNSFLTASLTTFPSTRVPCAANLAMTFFITVPMSFMVGDPISAITAFTPAVMSASLAALGM